MSLWDPKGLLVHHVGMRYVTNLDTHHTGQLLLHLLDTTDFRRPSAHNDNLSGRESLAKNDPLSVLIVVNGVVGECLPLIPEILLDQCSAVLDQVA
jgi:hypothetical protein